MKKAPALLLLILCATAVAQIGGKGTYQFLNLPASARVAAMGGKVISLPDRDLSYAFQNPALLDDRMHNNMSMNYANYFADINYGYFAYSYSKPEVGSFAFGIQYINYGTFIKANELGERTGHFSATEYAFHLMWSRPLNEHFRVGINLKPIISHLEKYESYGLVADAGILYSSENRLFNAAFNLRNMGTQIKGYYPGHYESLPFELLLGASYKLEHAPFRFTMTAQQLQDPDYSYDKPITTDASSALQSDEVIFQSKLDNNYTLLGKELVNVMTGMTETYADPVLRHFIVGADILLTEQLFFTLAYNYQRRQELKIDTKTSTVGLSFGFGLRLYKFNLSYGRGLYHLAGKTNTFSITTNLSDFYATKNADK